MIQNALTTKFYVPSLRGKFLSRNRLIERIRRHEGIRLILLSAPAGFGKTSLVADWVLQDKLPAAWVTLDDKDSQPSHFLTHLITALQNILPDIGRHSLGMLQVPRQPAQEAILIALLNDLGTRINKRHGDVFLILDDYHLVNSPDVDNILAYLLKHMPPAFHLVLITRTAPNFSLSRMRAQQHLLELRGEDIRFTAAETAELFNSVMRCSLSDENVAALHRRTEGWIAGLQLARIPLEETSDIDGFIRSFTGSHQFVIDYLIDEVLQRQSAETIRFLTNTSILNELCGPLCDAVMDTDAPGSGQKTLENFENSNLFIVPLDNRRRWYRYNNLFGDVLRQQRTELIESHKLHPNTDIQTLHRRASDWYAANGFHVESLHHAFHANDTAYFIEVLERSWCEMDLHMQSQPWLEWANRLSHEKIRNRPLLMLGMGWGYLDGGETEQSRIWIDHLEKHLDQLSGSPDSLLSMNLPVSVAPPERRHDFLAGSVAMARAYLAQIYNELDNAVYWGKKALENLPASCQQYRAAAIGLLSILHWRNGDIDTACNTFTGAIQQLSEPAHSSLRLNFASGLAMLESARGRLNRASHIYKDAIAQALTVEQSSNAVLSGLYLGLAFVNIDQGNYDQARQNIEKSEMLGWQSVVAHWPSQLNIAKAILSEQKGDVATALGYIDKAESLFAQSPAPDLRPAEALRVRILIGSGRLTKAKALLNINPDMDSEPLSYMQEFRHITVARLLTAEYVEKHSSAVFNRAQNLLSRLLSAAKQGHRLNSEIEIRVCQSLLHAAANDMDAAAVSLEHAVQLAESESYVHVFCSEGTQMKRLLTELQERDLASEYSLKLLSYMNPNATPDNDDAPSASSHQANLSLDNPLSKRELEVLELISSGFSNNDICKKLFIALSTVKGHNRKIFEKLGVSRRTEALLEARKRGLVR